MKYLKISSLLVLSLLLFAPAAMADVECELRPSSQRIRMESQHEKLAVLTVRCESEEGNLDRLPPEKADSSLKMMLEQPLLMREARSISSWCSRGM